VESRYVCVDWAQFCNKLGIINVKRTSVASMGFLDNGELWAGANLGFEKVAPPLVAKRQFSAEALISPLTVFPEKD
jgi:hypothetical protein